MANLGEAQKQMTRRLLPESGLELFRTKGYATTVDDIATAAGTTRVTFYAYCPSRSDLMRALIGEQLKGTLERVRSPEHGSTARDPVATVAEGTHEAVMSWLRRTAELWPAVRPVVRIGRDASVVGPDLPDLVGRWIEEAVAGIEDGLTAAGRLEPHQRRFRGVLAMAQPDYVAQHRDGSDWKFGRDQMLEELGASRVRLLN
ncbi:TetR/AcrR family transcriptional regulator [Streptomyces sp. DSM 41972]|uniref:TetR/AcrR family transcriptional regulator n=1 Tax=Streptomyces althioticus subsp. attaecolombicae TaxID=3075534 RepID=A0ABU3I012_9ACTN|nr:TetR/AcrR family transcriptional regulator [Streptomyces sp. DSM 41972]SCD77475.1 transcriptional regulator, TetR family [Streptomyces sp. di50b]SCE42434.1 transcriptional regulator, TetR family [Streptomyces sp. di188]